MIGLRLTEPIVCRPVRFVNLTRAKALFRWIQANHNYFTIFHGLDGNDIALVDSRLLPSFGRITLWPRP